MKNDTTPKKETTTTTPPTKHPSGAWSRSDYVNEYEKLRETLKDAVGGSFYGHSTGYYHCDPDAVRKAKAHLDSLQNSQEHLPR